jgi:hypothetical protein
MGYLSFGNPNSPNAATQFLCLSGTLKRWLHLVARSVVRVENRRFIYLHIRPFITNASCLIRHRGQTQRYLSIHYQLR